MLCNNPTDIETPGEVPSEDKMLKTASYIPGIKNDFSGFNHGLLSMAYTTDIGSMGGG